MATVKNRVHFIDTRFDRIDGQFSDVNRKIDYVHVQIEFGIIEQKIFAVGAQFEKLYNAPSWSNSFRKLCQSLCEVTLLNKVTESRCCF
jgi:hypothetical protein